MVEVRHGTAGGYTNSGCRCEACTAAATAAYVDWKARQSPLDPGDRRHGTRNGYVNYRCRCAACKESKAASDRARRIASEETS